MIDSTVVLLIRLQVAIYIYWIRTINMSQIFEYISSDLLVMIINLLASLITLQQNGLVFFFQIHQLIINFTKYHFE